MVFLHYQAFGHTSVCLTPQGFAFNTSFFSPWKALPYGHDSFCHGFFFPLQVMEQL